MKKIVLVAIIAALSNTGFGQIENNRDSKHRDMSHLKGNRESSLKVDRSQETEELQLQGVIAFTDLDFALRNNSIVREIDLKNQDLNAFPMELLQLTNLEILDLAYNNLTSIPEDISQLSKLRILALGNNQLKTVPNSIENLKNLEYLILYGNQKNFVLPDNVKKLSHLRVLWVSDLQMVPEWLWTMNGLEQLRLWNSNLIEVPSEIKNFKNLDELCFRGNNLTELPQEIYDLPNLTYLSVGENNFTSIDSNINKLRKLDYLGVFGNPITELNLDNAMLTHLRFIAAWDTQLSQQFVEDIKSRTKVSKVNLDGKGLF